jgi:tRNA modification GTPase
MIACNLQPATCNMPDTIFALSTAPGKSGIAVIRVSGPLATATLKAFGIQPVPSPRNAWLAALKLPDGSLLDQALVLWFPAPNSFTGEEVVEYHIHGSRAVVARLLAALSALPSLRPAEAGEFTRRAFLNGKMDLTAAEGLADLIDAETEAQRRQALRFMQGEALAFYQRLRQEALEALALMEAYIDFPDEDIPAGVPAEAGERAAGLVHLIESQLADSGAAERVREGVQVAILGPPNAGKSSLMNLLAKRDVAIVSHAAGTTRDVIEAHLDIGGYAVIVSDTAGLRASQDEVEREGIRRSYQRSESADVRILVLDASRWRQEIKDTALTALMGQGTILLLNKADLALPSALPVIAGTKPIIFSAKDGTGMEALLSELSIRVAACCSAESPFITRARHRHHLTQALEHLSRYAGLKEAGLELKCEELRRAAVEIGKITGVIAADEVLGQIFSRFCIGK